MDEAVLIEAWSSEESQPFSGWDFGYLRRRYSEEKPPWSYEELARDVLRGARSAVDLGTGGGEVLAKLSDSFSGRMVATEAYRPNWTIARDRLRRLARPSSRTQRTRARASCRFVTPHSMRCSIATRPTTHARSPGSSSLAGSS